jgi:acyl dehydratase
MTHMEAKGGSPQKVEITEEMLESERSRVGEAIRLPRPHIELTSKDAIRHWAEAIGDRNPLWIDEQYASTSPWGDVIAPPTIVEPLTPSASSGFRGIHAWHLGLDIEWNDVIRRDQVFRSDNFYEFLKEVQSSYAGGTAYDQVLRSELVDVATGKQVARYRTFCRRFGRTAGHDTAKYSSVERKTYTADELRSVKERYQEESYRGRLPRPVSEVKVDDDLDGIIRGPITSSDCIAFIRGWGGAFLKANGYAWDFLDAHPGAFPPDISGVPDTPERTHWDLDFAKAIGAPAPFDYGPQRISWCGSLVTNWMGDSGILRRLSIRLLKPGYHGDLLRLSGRVTSVDRQSGMVDIEIQVLNQLDEISARGSARVELPLE